MPVLLFSLVKGRPDNGSPNTGNDVDKSNRSICLNLKPKTEYQFSLYKEFGILILGRQAALKSIVLFFLGHRLLRILSRVQWICTQHNYMFSGTPGGSVLAK